MKTLQIILTFLLIWVAALPRALSAETRYRGMTVPTGIQAADIQDLGAGGFGANLARYLLSWDNTVDTATVEEYYTWLDTAMANLDAVLPAFEQAGIKIVLDLQRPPGGLVPNTNPHQYRLFAESQFQDAFVEVWRRLAQHYNGRSVIYAYDILNEPAQPKVTAGLKNWNDLSQLVAEEIRKIDSTTPIMVEPIYGDEAKFSKLKPLSGISNVIYSFHMYYPMNFQRQGLYNYPLGVNYPSKRYTKKGLRKRMLGAMKFQRRNKAKIYVGEFSVVRWAPEKSSLSYLRDMISIFEKRGWDWTFHAFREANVWSVEHSTDINDDQALTTRGDRAKLLISYFDKN